MLRSSALALTTSVAALSACGAGTKGAHGPGGSGLPPYEGHALQLFDDGIEPRAVGYEPDRAPPMNDSLVRERSQVGDAVVRARVTTVTSKDEDKGRSWQISLHALEKLAGNGPLDADFTVQVMPGGPASGVMRAFEGRLIGMTFVAFVREFARPGPPGDTDLHFHFAPDARDEWAAVHTAIMADQVR